MAGPGSPRFARYARFVRTLALGALAGFACPVGGIAQDFEATPIIDTQSDLFTASSALTLTLDTEQVTFGQLQAGGATRLDNAVVVTISGSSGTAWQLTCSALPTEAHVTDAAVETLSYTPTGTTDWTPFQPAPAPCLPPASGDAEVGFDYLVQVPSTTTPGAYDLIVTYSVTTLD